MRVSQIIKSVKVNPSAWNLIVETSSCLVFSNGSGWTFVRISTHIGGGYKLLNKVAGVEMKWTEEDAVGSQLWTSLCNCMLNLV